MDEEAEIKKIVEESLKSVSTEEQAKKRNPFKALKLIKKKEDASSSVEKGQKVKKAKSEKISRNFTIRASLGRRRKIADRTLPDTSDLERQTPEGGGSPLSVSDVTLSEIEKIPEISYTASAEERIVLPSEVRQSLKKHHTTVADRVSNFQQLSKKSTSSIRTRITRKFQSAHTESQEKPQESFMQQNTDVPKEVDEQQGVTFAIGTAVRPPHDLSHFRHITSLESDSEEASGNNFLEEPEKSPSSSERSLRRIAYVVAASSSQDATNTEEETLEIGLNKDQNIPECDPPADCEKMPAHGDLIADNVGVRIYFHFDSVSL